MDRHTWFLLESHNSSSFRFIYTRTTLQFYKTLANATCNNNVTVRLLITIFLYIEEYRLYMRSNDIIAETSRKS